MIKTMRIYFAHPIRGRTGEPDEMEHNCRLAKAYASFTRSYLGPGYDIYCPADHDEMPQIAWANRTFATDHILTADLAIVKRCQILIAGCWTPSDGVAGEIDFAHNHDIPVYAFTAIDSLRMICDTLRKTYG